jgi:hypothetical protein
LANFAEHINQAKSNLEFLGSINQNSTKFWDWQVTVSFYIAVHLVNAHIAKKSNLHYRSHEDVNNALNPFNELSLTKFSEELYISYIKLQALARRARYLCHDKPKNKSKGAFFTYDKHFSKAVINLDDILTFMVKEYSLEFDKIDLNSVELSNLKSNHFNINKV